MSGDHNMRGGISLPCTLGAYLKSLRKAMWKVSLEDMATRCGTSKSYMWELENDRFLPSLGKAKAIAKAYGTTLNKMGAFV